MCAAHDAFIYARNICVENPLRVTRVTNAKCATGVAVVCICRLVCYGCTSAFQKHRSLLGVGASGLAMGGVPLRTGWRPGGSLDACQLLLCRMHAYMRHCTTIAVQLATMHRLFEHNGRRSLCVETMHHQNTLPKRLPL